MAFHHQTTFQIVESREISHEINVGELSLYIWLWYIAQNSVITYYFCPTFQVLNFACFVLVPKPTVCWCIRETCHSRMLALFISLRFLCCSWWLRSGAPRPHTQWTVRDTRLSLTQCPTQVYSMCISIMCVLWLSSDWFTVTRYSQQRYNDCCNYSKFSLRFLY